MMNGLARAAVRFRPSSFVGSFVALLLASTVITACGLLLQTGVTVHLAPVRYANAPVVVAADPSAKITVHRGKGDTSTESTPLPDRARVDAALANRLAALPGVAAALPDLAFPVQATGAGAPVLTAHGFASAGLTVQGAQPGTNGAGGTDGGVLAEGRAPGVGEVVLDAATARAAHLAVGDRVTLTAPTGSGSYRIAGLADPRAGAASAWFTDALAGQLSGHPGRIDAIAVQPRPGVSAKELADQVRQAVGGQAKVFTGDARATIEQPLLLQSNVVLIALGANFGGIAAMTAIFVVMGTVALATNQRAREFALLRAIGATPRQIRRTIATEAMLLAPAAGVLGILPGLGLAHWWFAQLVSHDAVPPGLSLSVGPIPMLAATGTGLLSALLAGYLGARRPAKLRPSQALGESAVERARLGWFRTTIGTLALAGASVLAALTTGQSGLAAANTALGMVMCFLLAMGLLGPLVAHLATTVFGLPLRTRPAGAAGSLAADNSRANARRLASAITPIVMVTAFCGTLLVMGSSLKHVSAAQVRAGMVADQVIGSAGPGLPVDTAARAGQVPGVAQAVGVLQAGAVLRSGDTLNTASVLGVTGDPSKVLNLGVRDGSLSGLAPGSGTGSGTDVVAVDTIVADAMKVKVGDHLPMQLGDGTAVRPTVVAVYQRGLGLGELLLPHAALVGHVTTGYDSKVLVSDAPGADRAAVAAALARLGDGVPVTVTDAAGYVAAADHDQELSTWANTVMAGVLGGFAAVAAANTLVMTVLDRRREVGLLRLSGTTRRQVRGMFRWEALLVSGTGLLIGGAIAWATLVPITHGLTGSGPYVPLELALPVVGGVVLLSMAATALPGRALLREQPLAASAGRR
ncbi:FtsX-like permease family protein [Kitasatospora kifunensis]|uniref:Putative ABC transport system permease protein n=1 Tax=Kitasatospora kifunensis TaxID=58351 RepID=A0A7W7VX99_KITKI|nr:ABC transporter permease [Kitasatospora kifunensis]MBB4926382.1 putative ABC transport system permease protein [Kitasatospora kifunensis]